MPEVSSVLCSGYVDTAGHRWDGIARVWLRALYCVLCFPLFSMFLGGVNAEFNKIIGILRTIIKEHKSDQEIHKRFEIKT